jgi:crotonobetaine/carnitine-CoA ligase
MTPEQVFAQMVDDGDMVLDQLDRCALAHPDKTYLHDGEDGRRLSFAEVKRLSDRAAAGLVAMGLPPGAPVSVLTHNSLLTALAMFAIWRAGGVFAPINFNFTAPLLRHQLNDTAPFALISDSRFVPLLGEIAGDLTLPRLVLHQPQRGEHDHAANADPQTDSDALSALADRMTISDWADLRQHDGPVPTIARGPFDVANIVYTSGTTGPSKGVVQPFRWMNQYSQPMRSLLAPDDVLYCDLPLYHVGGAFALLTAALWRGNTVGLWNRFSPTRFWERIAECGASFAILLDVMIPWLMSASPMGSDRANTLNKVHMQPLPGNHHQVAQRFGFDFVSCGFGQTESGAGFGCSIDEWPSGDGTPPALWRGLDKAGYRANCLANDRLLVDGRWPLPKGLMGRPNPLLEVAVLDADDNHCRPGSVGQLAFRPRFPGLLLREYLGQPEATIQALRNCWFHTGDAVKALPEMPGCYAFVDRMGGFFRVRGENVSSYEVEMLMTSHPAVRAAAALPLPATVGDEDDIAVFVEGVAGQTLNEDMLREHAARVMPRYMQPRHLRIVAALPITPNNKIEKYKLKAQLLRELAGDA